ncbi:MAG: histidine kinase [Bacteroidaceae bacterium]|nr:histidine kinase [Bacteroidaceae bacterium]
MKWNRKEILIAFIHVAVMVLVITLPALGTRLSNADFHEVKEVLYDGIEQFLPIFAVYLLNYYWLIPRYYDHNRSVFFIANFLLILFCTVGLDIMKYGLFWKDDYFYAPRFYLFLALDIVMYVFTAACALAVSAILRLQDMEIKYKDMQQKKTEAELVWLKNQLNPHFLFNTLNNISSLVQIDADVAQDNITRLSSLLRYALYESNKPLVPLRDEVSFMENYINLMKLRCNERTTVDTQFEVPKQSVDIAPLLFISLLENAFKHGTSNHLPSFIKAQLQVIDGTIVFTCDNSNFPNEEKRTGKGVGLENLRRRLELLYPDRHEYIHTLENNVYHVEVKIKI